MGAAPWPGLAAVRLLPAPMFPVCSPELLGRRCPAHNASRAAPSTLIHEDDDREWREWLAAAGDRRGRGWSELRFDDGNLVLAAALAGQGVALTDDALAGEALADGRLVRLSEVAIATDKAYWLVHPPELAQRSEGGGVPGLAARRD